MSWWSARPSRWVAISVTMEVMSSSTADGRHRRGRLWTMGGGLARGGDKQRRQCREGKRAEEAVWQEG
ncbi:hypothetical protein NL676_032105 [Syzygium grande]|nr:hypothetical protein NL676_032105 [Syzygium grande]